MTTEHEDTRPSVQESLEQVIALLRKHELTENLEPRQEAPRRELVETLVHKLHLVELQKLLDKLHPADVAYILEALPLDQRLIVWDLVKAERDGEILLEVSDAVRETLIAHMDEKELVAATEQLDTDEIADLAPDLPREVILDVFKSLPVEEREQLRAAMSYPEDSVGALMDFDVISVREDVTVEVVLRYLRRFEEMPDHTDQLFVVDREEHLKGLLPIHKLLVTDPEVMIEQVMVREFVKFHPDEKAQDAAQAFERYDLVSAPVVDDQGRLIGRVTVNAVVDFIREETDSEMLSAGGLREDEDLFASVWKSVKNRWAWLAVNLVTAFIASRVIGIFEESIAKVVALAALMPIIAGIGGNSGNQTITMIVRALALGQITAANARKLFAKEIGVSVLNGLLWGSVVGLFAFLIYHNWQLGAVMTGAMVLNLLLAAVMGVTIPLLMQRLGRDPAIGSSVLITAITDSGGFFIFLGLATIFLV
ncbi:MAG: magnesium transporter [Burkholderiales bacterium]